MARGNIVRGNMVGGSVRVQTRPDINVVLMDNVATTNHTKKIAETIVAAARYHFLRMVKHTHPVTIPPYADSFYVRRLQHAARGQKGAFYAGNEDPVAMLVEFGAHPGGGPTGTLGYRPLGFGLDAAASGG